MYYDVHIPRCTHIKTNGTQCGSPALRGRRFCFFHKNWQGQRIQLNAQPTSPVSFTMPVLEDADSVQVALMQVIRLLLARQIDTKIAGLLLYALQTASLNLRELRLEPYCPESVVIDPRSVGDNGVGDKAWCKQQFKEQQEQEEEEEAAAEEAAEAAKQKAKEEKPAAAKEHKEKKEEAENDGKEKKEEQEKQGEPEGSEPEVNAAVQGEASCQQAQEQQEKQDATQREEPVDVARASSSAGASTKPVQAAPAKSPQPAQRPSPAFRGQLGAKQKAAIANLDRNTIARHLFEMLNCGSPPRRK
jgi:DNA polymerase III gamma/tau subunit